MSGHLATMHSGPKIGALFDFDGTLISGYSASVFLREQIRSGHISLRDFLELTGTVGNLALGRVQFAEAMASSARILRGVNENRYREFAERMYREHLSRLIFPEVRDLVLAHRRKGHTLAIVSSATRYQIESVARELGIDHIVCTRLKVARGQFTGDVDGSACWGDGKLRAAEEFAAANGIDLDRSAFYSDAIEDRALLERVGMPQVLNPDSKLEQLAQRRGWPVRKFASAQRPGAGELLRAVGVYGSLVSSALFGLGIWGLSGSRNEGRNAAVSLWADVACALVGIKVQVIGEQNLWAHRPAVVIANHQSAADALIILKILRGNFAAVGKKEITDLPLVSQAIQFIGVIPLDRSDRVKATTSMQALLDAMRKEGRFALIAPEGTRSAGTVPGPFKKGAFHIAMQAGVPIVPLVIHNSIEVQPKGQFVFRPATIKVEVLKPIDTSKWRVATLDRHIAEVRNLYLRQLGHPPDDIQGATIRAKASARRKLRRKVP